jgi:hypothetical protein
MSNRVSSSPIRRRLTGIAAIAAATLLAAACSSGATTPAPSAAPSLAGGSPASCPDLATILAATTAAPQWLATGTVPFTPPKSESAATASATAALAFSHVKPDQGALNATFSGLAAGGLSSLSMISHGQDFYVSAFGSQAWLHSTVAEGTPPVTDPILVALADAGLVPTTSAPSVDLPGSAPCVLSFEATTPTPPRVLSVSTIPTAEVQYVVMRVDPASALPQSIAFIADAASVKVGDPSSVILSVDYASSVSIPTPDAAFIVEVGSPDAPIPNAPPSLPGLPLP